MLDCVYLGKRGTLAGNRQCHHPQITAGPAGVPERFCRACPHRQPHGSPKVPPRTRAVSERCPQLKRRARDEQGKIKKRSCPVG